ncbi:carbon storage regulator [Planctomicrobium sp. SH661]|uniref:carbon storage regulator n=1 Tax=Planctomicrobium sp. SH661 TaxID=3448124 RepID=UPI003F5AF32C
MIQINHKPREVIHVTDEISVTILRLANGKVSIGVRAPKSVPVIRCGMTDLREEQSRRSVLRLPKDRAFRFKVVRDDEECGL